MLRSQYYRPGDSDGFLVKKWMKKNFTGEAMKNSNSFMLTELFMYRDLLVSQEQMQRISSGESYRQLEHRTMGCTNYEESVGDDLESFFNNQLAGRSWTSFMDYEFEETWTYFIRELTQEELELVEKKDEEYFQNFKWSGNPDVDEAEMQLSNSTSKYVSAYCNRKTFQFECKLIQWNLRNKLFRPNSLLKRILKFLIIILVITFAFITGALIVDII